MLLDFDTTKRQIWMDDLEARRGPARQRAQIGNLSFSVMSGGYPANFHLLRRLSRD